MEWRIKSLTTAFKNRCHAQNLVVPCDFFHLCLPVCVCVCVCVEVGGHSFIHSLAPCWLLIPFTCSKLSAGPPSSHQLQYLSTPCHSSQIVATTTVDHCLPMCLPATQQASVPVTSRSALPRGTSCRPPLVSACPCLSNSLHVSSLHGNPDNQTLSLLCAVTVPLVLDHCCCTVCVLSFLMSMGMCN